MKRSDAVQCNFNATKYSWFCNLILDREAYRKGMRELRQGNPVMGLEFALSYQPFEIFASGHVHVIY